MNRTNVRWAPGAPRAQGSTEYIILLGVVLVIALIAIGVLSVFPDSSSGIRISISDSYWGSASPMAVYDHSMTTDGILTLTVFNRGPKPVLLQGIHANGLDAIGQNLSSKDLQPGRQAERKISLGRTYRPYEIYEVYINLTYSDADSSLPSQVQAGKEPLIGHCSGESSGPLEEDCGGLLCNGEACGDPNHTPNECQSHHCYDTGGGNICVECIGNGHCPVGEQCVNYVCQ